MAEYACWKPEECARLAQLAGQGLGATEIALEMGRTRQSIYMKARQMKLALARAPRGGRAARLAKAAAHRWKDADVARLRELMAAHGEANVLMIARIMGRERSAVEKKITELALRGVARPQRRACMCCGGKFPSAGAHNRLCRKCRSDTDLPAQWEGF